MRGAAQALRAEPSVLPAIPLEKWRPSPRRLPAMQVDQKSVDDVRLGNRRLNEARGVKHASEAGSRSGRANCFVGTERTRRHVDVLPKRSRLSESSDEIVAAVRRTTGRACIIFDALPLVSCLGSRFC